MELTLEILLIPLWSVPVNSLKIYEKSCLQPGGRSRGKPDVFVDLFHDVIDVSEDAMRQSDPSRWVDVVAVSVHTVWTQTCRHQSQFTPQRLRLSAQSRLTSAPNSDLSYHGRKNPEIMGAICLRDLAEYLETNNYTLLASVGCEYKRKWSLISL